MPGRAPRLKYNLEVRSIARQSQSIEAKHDLFVRGIEGLPSPWGPANAPAAPDPGAQLVAVLSARKMLGKGVSGHIVYQFRRAFRDEASGDDYIDFSFNPAKLDYNSLIHGVFLSYVAAFDAYYADISDDEFIYMDFDRRRELRLDTGGGVYRLPPVGFFRRDLCRKAFKLSPAQIVQRLEGRVERVCEEQGGVFIVLTSEALPTMEMDALCWQAKSWLTG